NRRIAGPDARARAPDRDRSLGQTRRQPTGRQGVSGFRGPVWHWRLSPVLRRERTSTGKMPGPPLGLLQCAAVSLARTGFSRGGSDGNSQHWTPTGSAMDLARLIRDVPNFPKPGILFRDITPLLANPQALGEVVKRMAEPYRGAKIDAVVAAEARGFIFAAPLALELNVGFVPVRKPGKLPFDTHSFHYE